VTHDQEEALTMSDRIGVMREGRLVQLAEPQDLYRSPADHHVASFVGETNLFECDVRLVDNESAEVTLSERRVSARMRRQDHIGSPLSAGPALLAVRPEVLSVGAASTDFTLDAGVVETLFLGNVAVLLCESAGGARVRVQIPTSDHHRYALGDTVRVGWNLSDSRLLPAAGSAAAVGANLRGR
jgi:ABC-type Fe3+/spermidine/putrescine transport system ATPase subunit